MRHALLATAAALALLAAPLAFAQYSTQTPSPAAPTYSTPQTEPGYALPGTGAALPADPYERTVTPRAEAAPPNAYDTPNVAAAQPGDAQAGADADRTYAEANAPATQVGSEALPEAEVSLASLQEHAREAGMEELPMSPAQVCAPRSVDFEQSRLDRDARHQLIAAVDRASVCELQAVTIKAPENRAAAVRRELIASGVDESVINVETAAAGELEVDMAFNGVAASTPEFAALFNGGAQLASADPYAPQSSLSAPGEQSGYAPTSYDPDASSLDNPDASYDPNAADLESPQGADDIYDPNTTL